MLGIILAASRAFIQQTGVAFEPELALLQVVAHTHYCLATGGAEPTPERSTTTSRRSSLSRYNCNPKLTYNF